MHDRLQFSVRSMLLLTALFAVLLAVFVWKPSAASVLARFIVGFLLMSLAISAICITAGGARVFWIGVAVPLAMFAIRPQRNPVSIPRLTFPLYGFFSLTVALVAIAFFLGGMTFDRWRTAPQSFDDEPANTPVIGANGDPR